MPRVFYDVKALFAAAFLLFASVNAQADPGLDLAVLVDRSRSMTRHERIAPAILRMSVDLLARNAATYRVHHRIAVISFGSSVRVDVPMKTVGEAERAQLTQRINRISSESLGATDVLLAFAAAERLLRTLPSDPSRRRAIVLVTDGVPYLRDADMDQYMATLRRLVATQLPASIVSIDILLLSEPESSREEQWRALTTGVHRVDRSPTNVLATAHAVITQLVGTPSAESAPSKGQSGVDFLIVPPYLDLIVFDIFRASADTAVDVFPPDSASPLRAGIDGVEAIRMGDVLAALSVARPRPGQWLIRKSRTGAQVRVRTQQFFPRGTLLQPDPTHITQTRERVRIAYQVLDGTERQIEELPRYPFSLQATIAAPDGRKIVIPMERNSDDRSVTFRATEDAHCTIAGRYWTDMRVSTLDAGGQSLDVFRDRWSGFTVSPSQAPIQSAPLALRPKPAIARSNALIHATVATTLVLIGIGALAWRRKLRARASCLSRHPEQDER